MSRSKRFLYNTIATAIYQIIVMLVGFIVPRVMLEAYGSEINGLVSSITQFISYFNLVEAGLASAAVYALYKPLANKDYRGVNSIVSAAKNFYTISGYVFLSLVIGFAFIYPSFVRVSSLTSIMVTLLVFILGANGVLEFFTLAKYRVLLTADQKTYVISIASAIAIIINTLIIAVLAKLNVNIVLLRGIALISIFLRSIILSLYVKKKYKDLNYREIPNNKAIDKRWDALYLQIMGSINTGAPTIIATIFTSLKSVSIYSIYNMVMNGINGVLSIFISGLSASFGEVIVKEDIKLLQKSYNEFEFIYYSIITVVYSILMILIMPFIKIYTYGINDTNYNVPILGVLFVINGLLYNLKTPHGMLVISAGLYKETRIQTTIQGVIAISFEILLVRKFGIGGILLGSIIANGYRCIDLLFFVPKNITRLRVKGTLNRWIRIIITMGIIWIPFIFIKINANNLFQWLGIAIIVGIYAMMVVVLSALLFEKEVSKNVINRIRYIIKVGG